MMSVMYQEFSYDFPTPLASGAYGTDALEAGRRLLCLPSTQLRRHGATLAPGLVTLAHLVLSLMVRAHQIITLTVRAFVL